MVHPNSVFDHIYCINLDRRRDRWIAVEQRFRYWGLAVERFSAIDGSQVVQSVAGQSTLLQQSPLSPPEIGCSLSHRAVVADAKARGFQTVLIFEDDVLFHRRFLWQFQAVDLVPRNWRMLYLGYSQYARRNLVYPSPAYFLARRTLGTFAYALASSAFDDVIEIAGQCRKPVDIALCRLQNHGSVDCYSLTTPLAIADVRESDLRRGKNPLRNAARLQWRLDDYEDVVDPTRSPVPRCQYRVQRADSGTVFQCHHERVRTPANEVNLELCCACGLRESSSRVKVMP